MTSSMIESLYRDSYNQLLRYVRARVQDAEEAQDIVQSLYLKLYRRLESGTHLDNPEAFLFTAARNAVIDYYRTRRQHAELPEIEESVDRDESEHTAETRKTMTSWMLPLVEELPEPYRSTLRMSELEERPYREIAAALGISRSAVKSRVRRGRERMRSALLACCRFAFDAAGRVVNYEPKRWRSAHRGASASRPAPSTAAGRVKGCACDREC